MTDDDPSDKSITEKGYDQLVREAEHLEQWESPWADSHYQRHYVWPAVRPLLPSVANLCVLDAGCGVGHYTKWFAENGASVVGIDMNIEALTAARNRCEGDATFYQQDLTESFEFASAHTFDLVFTNLVLDHIEDWGDVFSEFARVLKPDGALVFTTIHPFRRYLNHREELKNYYEVEGYVVDWGTINAQIKSYHRPLGEIINPLTRAGFSITEFREARPQDEYEKHEPERYKRAMNQPDTLCVRARFTETG